MINNQKIILFRTITIGILYMIFFYITFKYIWDKGFVSLEEINNTNIFQRFCQDFMLSLILPIILLIKYRKNIGELGFTNKNIGLSILLFAIYLLFLLLHSDYTAGGFYRFIFYLIMVGFPEEIIMRGYIYLRIKPINRTMAVIISGIIFGAVHAIMPGILSGNSISWIGLDMLNYIGGGIVGGLLFIFCMELSGNILVAILIHSLLDYSYGPLGFIILLLTLGYLILKNRKSVKINHEVS